MFDRSGTRADSPAHELALECLEAGIDAAHPRRAVARHCSVDESEGTLIVGNAQYDLTAHDSILLVGGGKATADLAAAFESLLGDRLSGGVVVTDERTVDPGRVDVLEGEHPTPGDGSVAGARAVLNRAAAAGERDLVIGVIAGGGSALLCAPAAGLSVADLQAVTDGLLDGGASVDEINTVRRACSSIKGGGLAAAATPATVTGVLVSDVVGGKPSVIASGPTVPTGTDPDAALEVLGRYDVAVPSIESFLRETTPEGPADVDVDTHIVASGRDAVDAAAELASTQGYRTCILSTRIEGEATAAGRLHAAIAAEAAGNGDPVEPPAVILSGGETTVHVTGDGIGGPNGEFALAAAMAIPDGAVLGAVDTDGGDGSTDAAGALVDARTVEDPEAARAALSNNDSYSFLESREGLLRTGATGTNVNDLRVLVIPE